MTTRTLQTVAVARRRRRSGGFNVRRLFINGEAGAWYDPSDLTAEKVAWRRNLLTWSEGFANAAWVASAGVTVTHGITDPNGGTTAARLVSDGTVLQTFRQNITQEVGVPYTVSLWVRATTAGVNNQFRLILDGGAQNTVVNATGSWVRYAFTASPTTGGIRTVGVLSNISGSVYDIQIAFAQFERSPTATAYQRITDFTSDFLAAFPTHGLYQDAAGTTPVTALGQPVGLVIDSKTGGLANLGAELAATLPTPTIQDNGGSSGSWNAGTRTMTNTVTGTDSNYPRFQFNVNMTIGARYLVRGRLSGNLGGMDTPAPIRLAASGTANNIALNTTTGVFWGVQVAAITAVEFRMNSTVTAPQSVVIEELSVREVPGVHAIQATNSSRPLLDGRVNLLERTEEFDNAYWDGTNVTRTANSTTAPNGTTTADTVANTTASGMHIFYPASARTLAANVPYRLLWHVRKSTVRYVAIGIWNSNVTAQCGAGFDLDTGAVTGTGAVTTGYAASDATIENLGGGWYRLAVTVTSPQASNYPAFIHRNTAYASGAIAESYTGAITETTFIWGADLRLAADAAYPYQRVASATDYADVGVPRAFAFDGFDDSLYTASNMDLSGTDKVTVLAGVRKLSDAATGIAVELTSSSNVNTGSFALLAPSAGGANSYRFLSHGTGISTAGSGVFAAAPDISVLTGIADIAGDVCSLRRNGAAVVTSATDQGTGNYSSAVLFIGRRNNTSDPLTGKAYQIIVRGALTDDATLAQAQRYVGTKTGIFL